MNAIGFAWRSLVRQPARAALGILGVAAVGALLFDMLLLSRGLIVSMQDLLDRGGWDVRVSAGELPGSGLRISDAVDAAEAISKLPSVQAALVMRAATARIDRASGQPLRASFQGVTMRSADPAGSRLRAPWTILRGRDAEGSDEVVIDEKIASESRLEPGGEITMRASCVGDLEALPATRLKVVGIAEFPFQTTNETTTGGTLDALKAACGGNVGTEADLILVTSTGDADGTAAAIRTLRPEVRAATNTEVVGRLQQTGFTYFRQISSVLTTVTVSFAVLLITVLLTVSVNQRLGEIAALRALGFSRVRVVKDVLSESALIVGIGGLLSLPLGLLLASGLDRILKGMPGIPVALHFFVFESAGARHSYRAAHGDGHHRGALPDAHRVNAAYRSNVARRGDRVKLVPGPQSSVSGSPTTGQLIVDAKNVSRVFSMPAGPVTAVRDVTLQINSGDHIAVRGPSGCGKSTLLHMLGCVEPQTSGTLLFDGQDVSRLSDARRSLLRLKQIGFVFQRFFLLPMLTARENVELPTVGGRRSEAGATDSVRRNCSNTSDSRRAPTIDRRNCQAERCSVWRSRARSRTGPDCCSQTNPRASSTNLPARRSRRSSTASTRRVRLSSSSRMTPLSPIAPGGF